jgi:hypothetical protein
MLWVTVSLHSPQSSVWFTLSVISVKMCRYRRAQLALQKGDEDLAREALKRRKSYAVSIM